jgi:hypothetical protein
MMEYQEMVNMAARELALWHFGRRITIVLAIISLDMGAV